MRNLIARPAILVCLLIAAACDKAPTTGSNTDNNNSQTSSNSLFSYRFSDGQCDTYKRSFRTQKELCNAIQVSELNNENCAQDQREDYFAQNCTSITTPDEALARERIKNVNGKYVDCTYSEKNLPEIRQYSASRDMFMEHTTSRALVTHTRDTETGSITIIMQIFDLASGRRIGRTQKTWTNEAEPLSLSVPGVVGSPLLTCEANLAADPNRE